MSLECDAIVIKKKEGAVLTAVSDITTMWQTVTWSIGGKEIKKTTCQNEPCYHSRFQHIATDIDDKTTYNVVISRDNNNGDGDVRCEGTVTVLGNYTFLIYIYYNSIILIHLKIKTKNYIIKTKT